jgi:anti-sigma regulatory factor (Ser/Thr protein kinase)
MLLSARRTHDKLYPATAASVPLARHDLTAYAARAGVGEDQMDRIRLAVTEAVTNAVRHAYRRTPGAVQVTATELDGELWVLVADEGCGHQAPTPDPGLGWGLALIAQSCDYFVLAEGANGGTQTRMRFDVG